MSAVASTTVVSEKQDKDREPSPEQSPTGFTAVNGREHATSASNGTSEPHASHSQSNDRDNNSLERVYSNRELSDKDSHIPDVPSTAHVEQTENASTSDRNPTVPNHKRKRSHSGDRQISPETSSQAQSVPRSSAPLSCDSTNTQQQRIDSSSTTNPPAVSGYDSPSKTSYPDYSSVEKLDDVKANPSNNFAWDNYDSQAMNNGQRVSHQIDSSDAQLAEALQQDVQNVTVHPDNTPGDSHPQQMASYSQHQPPSQTAPKRKRVFSNRTKTGCMTCRRRKKKCDEQHPSCNNCIRGGFPCEGYSVRSTWQKPQHPKGPIPLQSKDRYPEPSNPYIQDMPPQRHDVRLSRSVHPDGTKNRPVSVDDGDRASSQYITSPNGALSRVAWPKGTWQSSGPLMSEHPAKSEFRDNSLINDASRPEQSKPEYHIAQPARELPHNVHTKPPVAIFENNIEQRPAQAPRIDSSSYPTQARLALSMEPHIVFESNGKTEKGKMLSGEQYRPFDSELIQERERCKAALWRFTNAGNPLYGISLSERNQLLKQVLIPATDPPSNSTSNSNTPIGSLGPGAVVETPFNCHYGYNINIGEDVLISENCFFADDCSINIGAHTWIGPNVTVLSSMAIGSMQERKGSQSRYQGRPVVIAEDCWIGAGCTILPGVTLGRGAYIAPGEVVRSQILPYGFQGLKPNYP